MTKGSVSSHSLGTFPSPGAPNYRENCLSNQKGWSSERVPHPSSSGNSRRNVGSESAFMTPFYSGTTLPSKWEDAERWICSPVSGYTGGICKNSSSNPQLLVQRRPKSKSGPIVPPGIAYYSSCSPAMQALEAGSVRALTVGSPFSTGVLVADGVSLCYGNGYIGGNGNVAESFVERPSNVPGWSDLVSDASIPSSQDEKVNDIKETETVSSPVVVQRDMATQMSAENSTYSSPRGRSSTCQSPPSILQVVESEQDHASKVEVKEVPVDKRVTMISWSKRHASRIIKKGLPDVEVFNKNARSASASSWDISETAASISKLQREEAKITAWENLQKAKAEAAIRKLEMELEKKKAASMDKILNKVKMAQMKAQEMRSSMTSKQEEQIWRHSHKITLFHKLIQMSSLRSCFTRHAM